jgi:hypothetical protein
MDNHNYFKIIIKYTDPKVYVQTLCYHGFKLASVFKYKASRQRLISNHLLMFMTKNQCKSCNVLCII